jgi:hypothetical protein
MDSVPFLSSSPSKRTKMPFCSFFYTGQHKHALHRGARSFLAGRGHGDGEVGGMEATGAQARCWDHPWVVDAPPCHAADRPRNHPLVRHRPSPLVCELAIVFIYERVGEADKVEVSGVCGEAHGPVGAPPLPTAGWAYWAPLCGRLLPSQLQLCHELRH